MSTQARKKPYPIGSTVYALIHSLTKSPAEGLREDNLIGPQLIRIVRFKVAAHSYCASPFEVVPDEARGYGRLQRYRLDNLYYVSSNGEKYPAAHVRDTMPDTDVVELPYYGEQYRKSPMDKTTRGIERDDFAGIMEGRLYE